MQEWRFSDGSTVKWNGSELATDLALPAVANSIARAMRIHPIEAWSVRIAFMPGGEVDLDLSNVWLVDMFLRNEAMRLGLQVVSSTYTPKHEDMNTQTRRIMERWWNSPPPEPGVLY